MHHALLIDDETTARADLRHKLESYPEVRILAEAATVTAARSLLQRTDYDLVFLDIQLIGGNAFDLVAEARSGARIIFVTAYDAFAVRAFEINALDYLLKPVNPERLATALARLGGIPATHELGGRDAIQGVELRLDDRICLQQGLKAQFALVAEISLISAHDNYSEVRLANGVKLFLRKSLKSWEEALPAGHFMRVHRTQIVNLAQVRRYERDRDEHTLLEVDGADERVPVSRDRWSELHTRLSDFNLGI